MNNGPTRQIRRNGVTRTARTPFEAQAGQEVVADLRGARRVLLGDTPIKSCPLMMESGQVTGTGQTVEGRLYREPSGYGSGHYRGEDVAAATCQGRAKTCERNSAPRRICRVCAIIPDSDPTRGALRRAARHSRYDGCTARCDCVMAAGQRLRERTDRSDREHRLGASVTDPLT